MQGEYGVYRDDSECFVSSTWQNEEERIDIRILLFDPDSNEILENLTFAYD